MEARLTGISRQETLRYLGYPGGPLPDDVLEQLETSEQELFRFAVPRVVWRLFDRDADGSLTGTDFTPAGADIREFLKDCDRVILMAATLGMETENLLRRTQARDMAKALYLTDRFSPGYGDLPLSQQKELFRLLDVTRRIGVSLSESGLMVPQKSVTALIGVSDRPQPKRSRGCETCTMFADCAYRKDGKNCGKP